MTNKVPYVERHKLPETPGVYMVFSGAVCLYVGSSGTLRTRLHAHHQQRRFADHTPTHIEWLDVDTVPELADVETAVIRRLHPTLNSVNARSRRASNGVRVLPKEFTPKFQPAVLAELKKNLYTTTIKDISAATGLSESWLRSFENGRIKEASAIKLETLHFHLTGKKWPDAMGVSHDV